MIVYVIVRGDLTFVDYHVPFGKWCMMVDDSLIFPNYHQLSYAWSNGKKLKVNDS